MIKERFSLAKNILSSNFGRLPFPYKLTLVLTYWCNYKCKTCNIWQKRPEDELTTDELTRFFKQSNRFNWIDFTGGEIWIRNDFVQIVESSIKNCKDLALIHFPTNGYFTQKTVDGVKEILKMSPPKLIITVSLDGDEETNDEIRGKKGGWKRQIETFRQLKEMKGVEVVLGMTLSKHNAGLYKSTFEAVKKVLPELRSEDFHVNIAHESSHFYNNGSNELMDNASQETIVNELKQYRKSRGPVIGPISFLENKYLGKVEKYLVTGKTPVRCHSLNSSCFIDSWGNVFPCVTYDHKLGNLRDYDFNLETIWNLPGTQKLQKEIWNGQCPQCWQPCEAYQSILGNLI
jgi:MoaA/NifB/PqqE/SkfB family radical SAM enzyme